MCCDPGSTIAYCMMYSCADGLTKFWTWAKEPLSSTWEQQQPEHGCPQALCWMLRAAPKPDGWCKLLGCSSLIDSRARQAGSMYNIAVQPSQVQVHCGCRTNQGQPDKGQKCRISAEPARRAFMQGHSLYSCVIKFCYAWPMQSMMASMKAASMALSFRQWKAIGQCALLCSFSTALAASSQD